MADRKVQVDILADEKGFTKGVGKAEQGASKFEAALKKLGPVGNGIQGLLDKIGISSIGFSAGVGAAAVGAIGATAVVIEKAIAGYVALGSKVREYAQVTSQSAEASSRQVQAFQILGVSEETAQNALFKLGKAIATTPQKLEALGIEIKRNVDGNVDLDATLLSVMNAYQSTTDAAKRAQIVFLAFGKAGQTMIPILETNAAELQRLEAQIKTVYSDADLARIRQYEIGQKELKQSQDELSNSIGERFLPIQQANTDALNENIYVNENLDRKLKEMGATQSQNRAAIIAADQALREEWVAAQAARVSADALATSTAAAAKAAQEEADAELKLYDALHKASDASDAYIDAELRLEKETLTIRDAMDNYNQTVKQYGVNSRQAKEAAIAYQEALRSLVEQYKKVADAAVANAEAQAEANGTTLTATEKAEVYRAELEKLMLGLAPNSPLRKNLQAYIDELSRIPSSVETKVKADYIHPGGKNSKTQAFAGGGMVGGSSEDHPVLAKRGEMVLTPEQQAALPQYLGGADAAAARGGDTHVHLHIGTLIGADGPGMDRLAREILQRARLAPGT